MSQREPGVASAGLKPCEGSGKPGTSPRGNDNIALEVRPPLGSQAKPQKAFRRFRLNELFGPGRPSCPKATKAGTRGPQLRRRPR